MTLELGQCYEAHEHEAGERWRRRKPCAFAGISHPGRWHDDRSVFGSAAAAEPTKTC